MLINKQFSIALSILILSIAPNIHSLKTTDQVSTEITANNFEKEVLQSKLPVILKISATWCPPCQRLKPLFEKAAKNFHGQCKFASMDYDTNVNFAEKHNIDTVPTFMIYNNGTLILIQPGCPPGLQALEKFVQDVLYLTESKKHHS